MAGVRRRFAEIDAFDLALGLTLLDLLLRPVGDGPSRFAILGLAASGLLIPGLLRRPELWSGLTLLTAVRVGLDWPLPDNHAYLLSYWCLAIAVSCWANDRKRVLATNGRLLIGLVFALATLWKLVLSPDFVDGTFFRVTLLVDPRFEGFTRLVGGLSIDQIDAARAALERHADGGVLDALAAAKPSPRLDWLALAMTGWTLVVEAVVALAFLWPRGRGPSKLRDALLILFCATTYAVATVEGFGWLLIAMGIAQSEPDDERTRAAYLAAFVLILFYREVPWLTWAADLAGRV